MYGRTARASEPTSYKQNKRKTSAPDIFRLFFRLRPAYGLIFTSISLESRSGFTECLVPFSMTMA